MYKDRFCNNDSSDEVSNEIVSVDDFCFVERTNNSEMVTFMGLKGKKYNVMIINTITTGLRTMHVVHMEWK